MAVVMQGIGSMAALSSTDPLSSMRFHLQPRKSLPVSDRNASVFIVRSDGRFPGGVNLRRYSVKKLVPNAVAAPADGPASAKPGLGQAGNFHQRICTWNSVEKLTKQHSLLHG